MDKGRVIVISGPSGVGKTTLYRRLLGDFKGDLAFSVSATTRKPRDGERDGVDYYFLSDDEFTRRVEAGDFVEWAKVYQNRYGTLKSEIQRILDLGKHCLLDIDVQGGMNIRKAFPESYLIFIAPPSVETLRERILGRKTESPESLQARLSTALQELTMKEKYDIIIINDVLETAYTELAMTVKNLI